MIAFCNSGMKLRVPLLAVGLALLVLCTAGQARASVGWLPSVLAQPTVFATADATECASTEHEKCDRYSMTVLNNGDEASNGPVTLTLKLPAHVAPLELEEVKSGRGVGGGHEKWHCHEGESAATVVCTFEEPVAAGRFLPALVVPVNAPAAEAEGEEKAEVTVEGGGVGEPVVATGRTILNAGVPRFEANEFAVTPEGVAGASDTRPADTRGSSRRALALRR